MRHSLLFWNGGRVHRTLTSVIVLVSAVPLCAESTCERLAKTAIPNAVITLSAPVAAGVFKAPEQPGGAFNSPTLQVRPFCRVTATLHPTCDSLIDVEVWPSEDWNGKYQAVGGGGWAGVISYGLWPPRSRKAMRRRPPIPATKGQTPSSRPGILKK